MDPAAMTAAACEGSACTPTAAVQRDTTCWSALLPCSHHVLAHMAACTNEFFKLLIVAAAAMQWQRACSCPSCRCTAYLELSPYVFEAALPLHCSRAMLRRPCSRSSQSPQTSSQPSTLFSASQARAASQDGVLSHSHMAATCMQQQVSHKPFCWDAGQRRCLQFCFQQVPGRALHGICVPVPRACWPSHLHVGT